MQGHKEENRLEDCPHLSKKFGWDCLFNKSFQYLQAANALRVWILKTLIFIAYLVDLFQAGTQSMEHEMK